MSEEKHFTVEESRHIGNQLGIDWNKTSLAEFQIGLDIEMEHGLNDPYTDVTGNDPLLTGKIAWAHLNEFPDYYTRLIKCFSEKI
jgi:hypothetical protein